MTVDSSALIAILLNEPERDHFSTLLGDSMRPLISAVSVLETYMTMESRLGDAGVASLDLVLAKAGFVVVPFDAEQLVVARIAFRRYGRGRHPAKLNFGDCMSYALAQTRGEPLLFKGNDFRLTDVVPAM